MNSNIVVSGLVREHFDRTLPSPILEPKCQVSGSGYIVWVRVRVAALASRISAGLVISLNTCRNFHRRWDMENW